MSFFKGENWGDGITYYICQKCGKKFKYNRGRNKNVLRFKIDEWLKRFRCPKCGKKV
jgi:DNA-directed RNA polymerase subunit RPC12/RpoP